MVKQSEEYLKKNGENITRYHTELCLIYLNVRKQFSNLTVVHVPSTKDQFCNLPVVHVPTAKDAAFTPVPLFAAVVPISVTGPARVNS